VLLLSVVDPKTGGDDIWYLSDRENPQPLLNETFDERDPAFHPTGRWFAYVSNESGRPEVSVRRFPGPGGVTPISTGGGDGPLWSRDGRELFYYSAGNVMVVDIQTEPQFRAGSPRVLLDRGSLGAVTPGFGYDVSADGRFVMIENPQGGLSGQPIVVLNWFEELNRLCPAGK
jgi:hypothetical protein